MFQNFFKLRESENKDGEHVRLKYRNFLFHRSFDFVCGCMQKIFGTQNCEKPNQILKAKH